MDGNIVIQSAAEDEFEHLRLRREHLLGDAVEVKLVTWVCYRL